MEGQVPNFGNVPHGFLNRKLSQKMVDMCFKQLRPTQRRFGTAVDEEIFNCFQRFMISLQVVASI